MGRSFCILFCALLALSVTGPISAKRPFGGGSRHSYPKSGGLSGGGGHHYGGLSGGSRGYPSSGGSHSYPSSGGSHSYPSSGGSNSNPSSGRSHSYPPAGGSHGYPSSGGLSGNSHGAPGSGGYPSSGKAGYPNTHHTSGHGYPAGSGLSGNTNTGRATNIHYHYNYNPPQQIRYTPMYGAPAQNYPVYRGSPPTYVYQYKDSGSKYGTLLAGLALLNLGTVAAGAYALSHSHSNYKPQPGEVCKFGVKKDNGDYEETKIDCQLITSFIFQEQAKTQSNSPTNTTITTTTVTNVTTVNITNPGSDVGTTTLKPNPVYEMLPNGTLVPMNVTAVNSTTAVNATNDVPSAGNTMTSSVTVTTTNTTTVSNALDVKGKPIDVTPGMQCFVMRHSSTSNMSKSVPCGLLQTYADQSLKKNSAIRNMPAFTILSVVLAVFVIY